MTVHNLESPCTNNLLACLKLFYLYLHTFTQPSYPAPPPPPPSYKPAPAYQEPTYADVPAQYSYQYAVKDDYANVDFGKDCKACSTQYLWPTLTHRCQRGSRRLRHQRRLPRGSPRRSHPGESKSLTPLKALRLTQTRIFADRDLQGGRRLLRLGGRCLLRGPGSISRSGALQARSCRLQARSRSRLQARSSRLPPELRRNGTFSVRTKLCRLFEAIKASNIRSVLPLFLS